MGASHKGKQIGEVEQITGISKREIKYCIEQGFLRPGRKSESGYWLYREEEIRRLRIAVLCRRLDIPNPMIRGLLSSPSPPWKTVLEQQVRRLEGHRQRLDARLSTARWLLEHLEETEWIETALQSIGE